MAKQIGKFLPALQRFKNAQRGDKLHLWPREESCETNEFLRSALFNARNRNQPRRHMNDVVLAMLGKGRISYRGEELRQDDATVWLQLVQFATESPLGEYVEFTPNAFCKAVGWSPSGDAYVHLRKCLSRLQATSLAFYAERTQITISLSMIPEFCWQDLGTGKPLRRYKVKLAKQLAELFKGHHYTYVTWAQRNQLPEGLATWLHGYFSSHREPFRRHSARRRSDHSAPRQPSCRHRARTHRLGRSGSSGIMEDRRRTRYCRAAAILGILQACGMSRKPLVV